MRGTDFFQFPPQVQGGKSVNNNWIPMIRPVAQPLQMLGLFKEWRCLGINVWYRLRYPPPVEYFYDTDDKLVSSRCAIHEIYYYPTGNWDQPTLNPRLSSGAREVSTVWQRSFVRMRDIQMKAIRAMDWKDGGYVDLKFELFPPVTNSGADAGNFKWHDQIVSPSWRPSTAVVDTAFGRQQALFGFFFKSDTHVEGEQGGVPTDSIEVKYELIFQFRGRKSLSMFELDTSNQGNLPAAFDPATYLFRPPKPVDGGTSVLVDDGLPVSAE